MKKIEQYGGCPMFNFNINLILTIWSYFNIKNNILKNNILKNILYSYKYNVFWNI
jgi:hypothetical protein